MTKDNDRKQAAGKMLISIWLPLLLLAACQPTDTLPDQAPPAATTVDQQQIATEQTSEKQAATAEAQTTMPPVTAVVAVVELPPLGYTHHRPDGNRLVAGYGALPQAQPLDVPLAGKPLWVTAVPFEEGALWAVVLEDSSTQAFIVAGAQVTAVNISPSVLLGTAPLLTYEQGEAHFVTPPGGTAGGNHPVRLNDQSDYAFTDATGQLFLVDDQVRELEVVDAPSLPDGRLLVDENGRLLALADPSTRYDHGVLGDAIEAASIILVEARPQARVVSSIAVPGSQVVEGLAPIWTDWDGDGQREIIVTLSDLDQGAQIILYDEEGNQLAAGPARNPFFCQ